MDKQSLRRETRALARALPAAYRAAADEALMGNLCSLPEYRAASAVFCFVSTPREVDTRPFLLRALADGRMLCVPRCLPEGQMALCRIESLAVLRPGAHGILEPPESSPLLPIGSLSFAVIPCLSCSRSGDRLGQGGGYYDRFLANYKGPAAMVCYERLLRDDIPTEAHDRRVPLVVTENGVYENGQLRR